MTDTLRALGPEAIEDWRRFLASGAQAARLADHFVAAGDLARFRDLLRFLRPGSVDLRTVWPFVRHQTLAGFLAAHVRTPELRQLLEHFARFLGLAAGQAPSVAIVIPYLVTTSGVLHPAGGFAALAGTLARLAAKHGAAIEAETRVQRLERTGSRVTGVVTDTGRRIPIDGCVAAVDIGQTARWLGRGPLSRLVGGLGPTLAARVAWWLLDREPALGGHHTLVFEGGAEPLYVATPSATDPTLAPAGTGILYALLHATPGEPTSRAFADSVRRRLEAAGLWPGGSILAGGVAGGMASCYGYAIRPGLRGSLRPSQRVPGLANLVLAGASVFPGPGIANVLRSGLRAADLLEPALERRGT